MEPSSVTTTPLTWTLPAVIKSSEPRREAAPALENALPHLSREEVLWRLHFTIGSLSFTAGLGFLVERWSGAPGPADDPRPVIARLVGFLTGGMNSPLAATGEAP